LLFAGFARDDMLVTVEDDGKVRAWQLPRTQGETLGPDLPAVMVQAPEVHRAISLTNGKTVHVKTPCTSASLRPPQTQEKLVEHAVFSPDGHRVVTSGEQDDALVWDSVRGTLLFSLRHKASVTYAAFSSDGSRVITAGADGTARVWDALTGEPVGFPLKAGCEIERVAFRTDGKQIVLTGKDGFVKTWDLNPEGGSLEDLLSLAQVLSGRRVDPDGALVPLESEALHTAWEKLRRSPSLQSSR